MSSHSARRAYLVFAAIAVIGIALACALAPRGATAAAATATVSAAATSEPLPSQMATTCGAEQLVIVTVRKLGETTGTLQVFDEENGVWVKKLTASARLGKRGVVDGLKRKANTNTTPTGIWAMPAFIFGTHAKAPSGSKMKWRRIDSRSWWSQKRGATYNTWVEARHWDGEHLASSPKSYEYALSTGYNAKPNPSVYGRGTAIFLHIAHRGLTAGCVEISRAKMIALCKLLDRGMHPHFAIGTLRRGASTSIWAY